MGARVVGQVDRKFIACVVESSGRRPSEAGEEDKVKTSTLILIDQHAADERVRVERFLKELCLYFLRSAVGPGTDLPPSQSRQPGGPEEDFDVVEELDTPVPVLLTHAEAARIVRSEETRKVLERWGVGFVGLDEVVLRGEGGGYDSVGGDAIAEEVPDVLKIWKGGGTKKKQADMEKEKKGSGYTQVMVKTIPSLLRDKVRSNFQKIETHY